MNSIGAPRGVGAALAGEVELHRRLQKIGIGFFVFTSLVLVSVHVLARYGPRQIFRVQQIVVDGNRQTTAEEIVALSGVEPGVNLFETDLQAVAAAVRQHPWVAQVSVRRLLPATLKIDIRERRPLAWLAAGELLVLDDQAVLLRNQRPGLLSDLPVVTGLAVRDDNIGKPLSGSEAGQLVTTLRILRSRHPELFARVSEVCWVEGVGVVATLVGGATQIILGEQEYEKRLDRATAVLRYLDGSGRLDAFRYLDTRYAGQVVGKKRAL